MRLYDDVKLDYSDVMLLPACNPQGPQSRSDVKLDTHGLIPIIAANMDGVGTFEMAKALTEYGMMTALHKHYELDELITFFSERDRRRHVIYSMGISDKDQYKFHNFWTRMPKGQLPMICIDVANGYTEETAAVIKKIKTYYGTVVMAGNVVTPTGVLHLATAGADIIKVGIGPGSVCTTRRLTGIGYPQFSAILECVAATYTFDWAIKGDRPKIVADGGITCPGDIAKALAAGAHYVMVGGLLAGHDEGGGENVFDNRPDNFCGASGTNYGRTITHKKFYGMASKKAQNKHNGGVSEYRASEGKEVLVPYRGPVKTSVQEILGGLRSSCAYQGVMNLSEISLDPEFIRVSRQLNNVFGA